MIAAIRYATACAAVSFAGAALAGTQVLGYEIGTSTAEQVQTDLAKKTQVQDAGTNRYSGGPMLKTDGSPYGVDGLNEVTYIFDDQKKLMAVIMSLAKGMDMNNGKFNQLYKYVSTKYKLISEQRPFVGNQFAKFSSPDSTIEIDAPHLGFAVEVRYLRNDLVKKFNAQSQADQAAKKKSEAAQF